MPQATTLDNKIRTEAMNLCCDYSLLAQEYYDSEAHPTCANLNELSRQYINQELTGESYTNALELGSGLSSVAPLRKNGFLNLQQLVVSDKSDAMLTWSNKFQDQIDNKVLADNEMLLDSFIENQFDLVVCSLGDPYNNKNFWHGLRAICRVGATIIFTTPSYSWSSSYRILEHSPPDKALFITKDNNEIYSSSYILDISQQLNLVKSAELKPIGCNFLYINDINENKVSPKFNNDEIIEIVVGYRIKKSF